MTMHELRIVSGYDLLNCRISGADLLLYVYEQMRPTPCGIALDREKARTLGEALLAWAGTAGAAPTQASGAESQQQPLGKVVAAIALDGRISLTPEAAALLGVVRGGHTVFDLIDRPLDIAKERDQLKARAEQLGAALEQLGAALGYGGKEMTGRTWESLLADVRHLAEGDDASDEEQPSWDAMKAIGSSGPVVDPQALEPKVTPRPSTVQHIMDQLGTVSSAASAAGKNLETRVRLSKFDPQAIEARLADVEARIGALTQRLDAFDEWAGEVDEREMAIADRLQAIETFQRGGAKVDMSLTERIAAVEAWQRGATARLGDPLAPQPPEFVPLSPEAMADAKRVNGELSDDEIAEHHARIERVFGPALATVIDPRPRWLVRYEITREEEVDRVPLDRALHPPALREGRWAVVIGNTSRLLKGSHVTRAAVQEALEDVLERSPFRPSAKSYEPESEDDQ